MVDDNPTNLNVCRKALMKHYDVYPAPSAETMFVILKNIVPDLILLDVEMPETNGYEAIRLLKEIDAYKDIPVIFLTAMDDADSEVEGLELGAVDYIHKPFNSALLIKRIQTHITFVEDKRKLLELNESVKDEAIPHAAEAPPLAREIDNDSSVAQTGYSLREKATVIIRLIERAITSDDFRAAKHHLSMANVDARLLLKIINDELIGEEIQ